MLTTVTARLQRLAGHEFKWRGSLAPLHLASCPCWATGGQLAAPRPRDTPTLPGGATPAGRRWFTSVTPGDATVPRGRRRYSWSARRAH